MGHFSSPTGKLRATGSAIRSLRACSKSNHKIKLQCLFACHNLKILAANHEFLVNIARYALLTEAVHLVDISENVSQCLAEASLPHSKFVIFAQNFKILARH